MTKFLPVAMLPDSIDFLYELLEEREPKQNISHEKMPTYEDHEAFVKSEPYKSWHIIEDNGVYVGAVYFTHRREIGVFIKKDYIGCGYGKDALAFTEVTHGRPILANISFRNARSMVFFQKSGFEPLQMTWRLK